MGDWGISSSAAPKEKLKAGMSDFLNGLNATGEISYRAYSQIWDYSMKILDQMYDLREKEVEK